MTQRRNTLSASMLATYKVENTAGESLGTIKELVIELSTGKVAYAVLSYGGVLGVGEKLFAISWSKLVPDPEKDRVLILDMPKEKFDKARGFNPDQWPDEVDPSWPLHI